MGTTVTTGLKLLFRWRVLAAVGKLLYEIGKAYGTRATPAEPDLTNTERAAVLKAFWHLVRVYRGR